MEDGKRIVRIFLNILIPLTGIVLVCTVGPWLLKFFMPFVVGWCIAMIANPLVKFLEKRVRLVRRHSSVLIVVVVLAGVIGVIYFLVSRLVIEVAGFIEELPMIYEAVKQELHGALAGLTRISSHLPRGIQDSLNQFNENLGEMIGGLVQDIAFPTVTVAGNVAKRIPAGLVYSVVVILSSYFFIVGREELLMTMRRVVPQSVYEHAKFLRQDAKRLISGYFLAQFRIMFVVAVILALGFIVLGVSHGVLLALLIALLDFLPLFGTGTALIPWAIVKGLSGEWAFAAGLIFLYLLTQVVRQIIQPKIVGDSLGLPPLWTLVFLYIGFKFGGISGMIVAVPLAIIALSLYKHGLFDSLIANVKLLIEEVNRFRKEE